MKIWFCVDFKFKPNKGIWKRPRLSSSSRVDHELIFVKVRFGWWIDWKRGRRGRKGSDCWPSVIVTLLGSEGGSHVGSVKISKVYSNLLSNETRMMLKEVLEYSNKGTRKLRVGFFEPYSWVSLWLWSVRLLWCRDDVKLLNLGLGKNNKILIG